LRDHEYAFFYYGCDSENANLTYGCQLLGARYLIKKAFFMSMLHNCYKSLCAASITLLLFGCAKVTPPLVAWLPAGHAGVKITLLNGLPIAVTQVYQGNSTSSTAPLHVYIEGDGAAFSAQGLPSRNPTPRSPVALQLAQADRSGTRVMYLGRPCQWVDIAQYPACTPAVWTVQRFTPEILQAYSALVKQLAGGQPITLIGHSGGAWLAYSIAQQVPQVIKVIAVAGNLNPNMVNSYHHVPALPVAPFVNPARYVPLVYLAGEKDTIIPPEFANKMIDSLPDSSVLYKFVNGATHTEGFSALWPAVLNEIPKDCPL
jgi:hypothetical protein